MLKTSSLHCLDDVLWQTPVIPQFCTTVVTLHRAQTGLSLTASLDHAIIDHAGVKCHYCMNTHPKFDNDKVHCYLCKLFAQVVDRGPMCVSSLLSWWCMWRTQNRCVSPLFCHGGVAEAACVQALQLMLLVIGHCS